MRITRHHAATDRRGGVAHDPGSFPRKNPGGARRSSGEPMPDEHAPPRRPELFARRTTPRRPGPAQIHTGPRCHHTPGSPPGIGAYSALACHPGTTSHTPGSGLSGSGSAISVPSSGPPTSRTSLMRPRSQTAALRVRRLGRRSGPTSGWFSITFPYRKPGTRAKRTSRRRGSGVGPATPWTSTGDACDRHGMSPTGIRTVARQTRAGIAPPSGSVTSSRAHANARGDRPPPTPPAGNRPAPPWGRSDFSPTRAAAAWR